MSSRAAFGLSSARRFSAISARCSFSTKASQCLRILFCGSDEFSCVSLRALHEEHLRTPAHIKSIDVLCRPGKRYGRGLKTVRESPIKSTAQELGLNIYERDTFTGWELPKFDGYSLNLIVAVSFGLFVPPRILNSVEYGGVNVHPSLLPSFRGPAPLQHTLLSRATHTGVTLQTLHPFKFDHGKILAQTPLPGFEIPNAEECTYDELLKYIAPKGAEILVQGIRDGAYLPNYEPKISNQQANGADEAPIHAPKITPADRRIDWINTTRSDIILRHRILGRLWSIMSLPDNSQKRLVFEDVSAIEMPAKMTEFLQTNQCSDEDFKFMNFVQLDGTVVTLPMYNLGDTVCISTKQNEALLLSVVTVEGKAKMSASQALFGTNPEGLKRSPSPLP